MRESYDDIFSGVTEESAVTTLRYARYYAAIDKVSEDMIYIARYGALLPASRRARDAAFTLLARQDEAATCWRQRALPLRC